MAAICTTSDGAYIFLALEDSGTGNQVITKVARTDLSSWTAAYEPGGGSAANVAASGNPDRVYFYGNFGSGIQVVKHTVSTGANANVSPTGLTTKVVNCLAVNPSDADELIITVNTDQDVMHSTDAGANWETWDATLAFDATALFALWSGAYELHRYFVAGDVAGTIQLKYSPNEGSSDADQAGAALGAVANVCGVETSDVTA